MTCAAMTGAPRNILYFCAVRWLGLVVGGILWAQDTLHLTIAQAEQRFLERNLLLLAQRLRIQAEQALVWQARLWPNPQLTVEQLDPFTQAEAPVPPFLTTPRINQIAGTLSQTLLTAQKRLKGIALAQASVAIQEAAFAELLRTLRYELRSSLYALQRDQLLMGIIQQQLLLLEVLRSRYRELSAQGLVPLPEYLRVENLYLQVQADLRELRQRWEAEQHSLRQLLRTEIPAPVIWIDTAGFYLTELPDLPPLDSLLRRCTDRGDVRLALAEVRLQEATLALERAMAYPDVDLVLNFDRLGGYRVNQWGVGFALPLPLFHRNQGRILSARHLLSEAQLRYEQARLTAESEVLQAWRSLAYLHQQWQSTRFDLLERYQRAEAAYRENLLAGRVSFLTYIDFFQSYRELAVRMLDLFFLAYQTQNTLDYAVGMAPQRGSVGRGL